MSPENDDNIPIYHLVNYNQAKPKFILKISKIAKNAFEIFIVSLKKFLRIEFLQYLHTYTNLPWVLLKQTQEFSRVDVIESCRFEGTNGFSITRIHHAYPF